MLASFLTPHRRGWGGLRVETGPSRQEIESHLIVLEEAKEDSFLVLEAVWSLEAERGVVGSAWLTLPWCPPHRHSPGLTYLFPSAWNRAGHMAEGTHWIWGQAGRKNSGLGQQGLCPGKECLLFGILLFSLPSPITVFTHVADIQMLSYNSS